MTLHREVRKQAKCALRNERFSLSVRGALWDIEPVRRVSATNSAKQLANGSGSSLLASAPNESSGYCLVISTSLSRWSTLFNKTTVSLANGHLLGMTQSSGLRLSGRFQRPSERVPFSDEGGFVFSEAPFKGTLHEGLKGASPSEGFKEAWRDLKGLEGGFKGAWRGLEAFNAEGRLRGGLKGASRGLEGGLTLKGTSRGLEGGLKPSTLKGASSAPLRWPQAPSLRWP